MDESRRERSSLILHPAFFFLVLVAPLIVCSAPALLSQTRLALALRGKSWNERRAIVFGGYPGALRDFCGIVPPEAAIAVVPARPDDRDVAMFSVYHLYPRSARVYMTFDDWRRNEHGGADRTMPRPRWVIVVDQSQRPAMTLLHDDGVALREVAKR